MDECRSEVVSGKDDIARRANTKDLLVVVGEKAALLFICSKPGSTFQILLLKVSLELFYIQSLPPSATSGALEY